MVDPGMVYEAPLFIVLGEREYSDDCMVDFYHWIETVDGVIIDPTAGQFELGEPALMILWPDSRAYAHDMPWRLQTVRTHGRRHPRAGAMTVAEIRATREEIIRRVGRSVDELSTVP